jgi:hypothetical protein
MAFGAGFRIDVAKKPQFALIWPGYKEERQRTTSDYS